MLKTKQKHKSKMLEIKANNLLKDLYKPKSYSQMLSENIKRGIRAKKERERLNKK